MSYTGKQRVIINALPDFVIENSKNLLEHVNLDGAALENQTISQIRAALTPDSGNTVLVDVGGQHTTFSIIVDGVLRSSSHIPAGTDKITSDLGLALGLDDQTAEFFKKDLNLVNLFHLPKQIVENLAVLKSELMTFVELNKKISQDPQKVIITGGGVYTPGFIEYFRDFPIPVYLANCFRQIQVPEIYRPYITPIANQLSTAIGLACRSDV
jgi:cell division ATPase FtsA